MFRLMHHQIGKFNSLAAITMFPPEWIPSQTSLWSRKDSLFRPGLQKRLRNKTWSGEIRRYKPNKTLNIKLPLPASVTYKSEPAY